MIFKDNNILVYKNDNTKIAHSTMDKEVEYVPLRSLSTLLPKDEMDLLLKEFQMFHWMRRTNFCGVCGEKNGIDETEGCRVCPECGEKNFPYLFPAVIVSIIKDDKVLLAHNTRFPGDMYSVIAGFVDVGENLEEAVVREIREEVGIEVDNVSYVASQNWGYSSSLMVAFTAEYKSGDIKVDGVEIEKADWFTVNDLPELPPVGSIGRFLVERFKGNKVIY